LAVLVKSKTGTEATPVDVNKKDVNGDGQPDVLLKFRIQDTGIQCGDIPFQSPARR
jgi:hypothetical protein